MGEDVQDTPKSPSGAGSLIEAELSLQEVWQAKNYYKLSLNELSDQLKTIREELSFVRHDLKKGSRKDQRP